MHYSNITAAADALADFTIAADDVPAFRSAVDTLARLVTEKRNTIPILQHIAIYAAPDGLTVEGTDLDLFAAARVPAVVETPGTFTINAFALRDALRKAPKGHNVRISTDGKRALMRSGRAALNLYALPADDWPSLKPREFRNPLSWESDAETLSGELARLAPFMSTEETRYYLCGIYAHRIAGKRTLAVTNGHVAAVIERDDAGDDEKGGIMPAKVVALAQAIAKEGERFAFTLDDLRTEFTAGRWSVRAKMIDGTFPDYARVFPVASGNILTVEARELLDHAAAAIKAGGNSKKSGNNDALVIDLAPGACRAGMSVNSASPYARPLSGEYRGEPLSVGWNPAYLKALATPAAQLALDVPRADGPSLVIDPDAPHFRAAIMPMRHPGLPEPERVTYPDITAAPGRAGDLFGVERFADTMACGKGSDKPRKATEKECDAYLVDYAQRCDLPIMENRYLVRHGGEIAGLTFGFIREAWTERHKVTDKWGAERDDYSRDPIAHHPAQYADGAYSIPMPGRNQAPVTVETMGEYGQWSAPIVCSDAAGNIMLPDAPKVRKAKSAPVERKEAPSAPDAAPAPENAPQPPVSGEIDPIDALSARLDAAEAAIAERPRIRIKAVAVIEAPSDGNVAIGPWPGAQRRLAERDQADAARAALVRARRERIVRAYLAIRAQRAALRREVEHLRTKRARAVVNARRQWNMRLVARGQYQRAESHADREHEKRARAVLLARSLQKRLNAEHGMVDRANERRHDAEKALADYRTAASAQRERACSERDTAKRLLSDAREKLATVTRERDGQANAIAALAARIERIEAARERLAA